MTHGTQILLGSFENCSLMILHLSFTKIFISCSVRNIVINVAKKESQFSMKNFKQVKCFVLKNNLTQKGMQYVAGITSMQYIKPLIKAFIVILHLRAVSALSVI